MKQTKGEAGLVLSKGLRKVWMSEKEEGRLEKVTLMG